MGMRRWACAVGLAATVLLAAYRPGAAQTASQTVVDLPLAGGMSERAVLVAVPNPRATVVLLPGGNGVIRIGDAGGIEPDGNFLVRTRSVWPALGISALVVG